MLSRSNGSMSRQRQWRGWVAVGFGGMGGPAHDEWRPTVEPRYPRSGRRGDDGHRRRESGVLEERRADQRRPGPEVAGLGPGLAALLPDDRRAGLDQVHLPGVPGRYGVAHVRP